MGKGKSRTTGFCILEAGAVSGGWAYCGTLHLGFIVLKWRPEIDAGGGPGGRFSEGHQG